MTLDRTDENFRRFRDLTTRLIEFGLSDQEKDEFEGFFGTNPEFRDWYIEHMAIHGLLRFASQQPLDADLSADEMPTDTDACQTLLNQTADDQPMIDRARTPVLGLLGEVFHAGGSFLSRSFILTLLLTLGLPGVLLVVLLLHIASQPIPEQPVVAQIVKTSGCTWGHPDAHPVAGAPLLAGGQLKLRDGLVEIAFNNGAHVILEGPATFVTDDVNQGFLHAGNLVANVPKRAVGFTVDTPTAKIIDLGTEFGVSVTDNGMSEAHVFKGQVDVAPATEPNHDPVGAKHLRAGQAVKVLPGKSHKIVTIASNPQQFTRQFFDDLPQPKVVFSHCGAVDPQTEGWRLHVPHNSKIGSNGLLVGPGNINGIPAWSFRSPKDDQFVFYTIDLTNGLNPQLVTEAKQRGWVMRARVWVSDHSPLPTGVLKGLCHFSFSDGSQTWVLHPTLDKQGNQALIICQDSSLGNDAIVPVPDSRNQYVNYEIRYRPTTKTADVYINGRRVATDFSNPKPESIRGGLRFGMWKLAADTCFAQFDWGILPKTNQNISSDNTDLGGQEALPKADAPSTRLTIPTPGTAKK